MAAKVAHQDTIRHSSVESLEKPIVNGGEPGNLDGDRSAILPATKNYSVVGPPEWMFLIHMNLFKRHLKTRQGFDRACLSDWERNKEIMFLFKAMIKLTKGCALVNNFTTLGEHSLFDCRAVS